MTNVIQLFEYHNQDMRIIEIDGAPWFVAKDVCEVLEIGNTSQALQRIGKEDLTSFQMRSGGQRRNMNLVSESGLYDLVFDSTKPEAKKFRRWVTHEVIPSIRKHGHYGQPQSDPLLERLVHTIADDIVPMLRNQFEQTQKLVERMMEMNQALEPKPRRVITTEERETILRMSCEGHGSTPIGDALNIKPGTVSSIISRARQTGELD